MKKIPLFLFALMFFLPQISFSASSCGLSPQDWCRSAPGDICGKYRDKRSCQGDFQCEALPYRGESMVTCQKDERGFASNCPTVGCRLRSELLQKSDCVFYEIQYGITKWENERCRSRF